MPALGDARLKSLAAVALYRYLSTILASKQRKSIKIYRDASSRIK